MSLSRIQFSNMEIIYYKDKYKPSVKIYTWLISCWFVVELEKNITYLSLLLRLFSFSKLREYELVPFNCNRSMGFLKTLFILWRTSLLLCRSTLPFGNSIFYLFLWCNSVENWCKLLLRWWLWSLFAHVLISLGLVVWQETIILYTATVLWVT